MGAPIKPNAQHWYQQKAAAANKPKEQVVAFRATPKQSTWFDAVLSGLYKFLAIGGGIRGTKSIACMTVLVVLCRVFPRSRWAIVRKDLPTIRRNVLPTMEKVRLWSGGFVGPLNQSTWSYTCANGSVILLFPEQFIQDPELERWKGLEVNGFDLEEGSELSIKSFNKAIERAGSWVIPATEDDPTPRQPTPLVLVNFNPCANWPRSTFFEPWKAGTLTAPYYFLPATIADNPFASEEYKESLKYLPPEEYRRFVLGEWDFVDDPDQLIKAEWVWDARNVIHVPGIKRLGVDVARFGDDNTSLIQLDGNGFVWREQVSKFDTTRVATLVLNRAAQHGIDGTNVRVDGVGLGAGVVDICVKENLRVYDFISGAKPLERPKVDGKENSVFKFKNLRSQAWWEFREKLRNHEIAFVLSEIPEKLVGDLTTPRYEISGDKVIAVESKDSIKQRLGRSTDDGDAIVMAALDLPAKRRVFIV